MKRGEKIAVGGAVVGVLALIAYEVWPKGSSGGGGGGPTTPLQQAAYAMTVALQSNGYRQSDQQIYKDFQTAAGLTADGFPGTNTMNALQAALNFPNSGGYPFADGYTGNTIVVYPWAPTGAYDGQNAPPSVEWQR